MRSRSIRAVLALLFATAVSACVPIPTDVWPDGGSGADTPESVAARRHFFGAGNVDASGRVRTDRVIVSWFGVTSLAASFRGHVVLLDAYLSRPNPSDVDELVLLRPQAIFLGHAHYDHLGDAGEIVARTGAQVIGTPEH